MTEVFKNVRVLQAKSRPSPENKGVWGYGRSEVTEPDAGHMHMHMLADAKGSECAPPKLGLMKHMCCFLSQPAFAKEDVDFTLAVRAI